MAKALSIEFDEVSLRRFYKRIDPDNLIEKPLDSFYDRVGKTIEQKAKHNAPEDTGKLRRSIKYKKVRGGAVVLVGADYGLFVHEGTKPHWPPVSALQGWADRHGISPYAVAAGIAKHGTRAQPFLRDALEQTQKSLPLEIQRMIGDIEERYVRG
jgi:HK97 gp10 family phage protein